MQNLFEVAQSVLAGSCASALVPGLCTISATRGGSFVSRGESLLSPRPEPSSTSSGGRGGANAGGGASTLAIDCARAASTSSLSKSNSMRALLAVVSPLRRPRSPDALDRHGPPDGPVSTAPLLLNWPEPFDDAALRDLLACVKSMLVESGRGGSWGSTDVASDAATDPRRDSPP